MGPKRIWQSAVARTLAKRDNAGDPLTAAEQLATALLGDNDAGKTDLDRIANELGVTVNYKSLRVDALLRETESGFVAVINSGCPRARQRFSIAHEIGHLVIYHETGLTEAFGHTSSADGRSLEASEVEDLCNHFASELLMPGAKWCRELFEEGLSRKVIRRLSDRYQVSIPAAVRQIVDAGPWRCGIILWKPFPSDGQTLELVPGQFWTNMTFGEPNWPRRIGINEEFRAPGSPLHAFTIRSESTGEIPVPFNDSATRCWAQSYVLRSQPLQLMTLILGEPNGKEILSRACAAGRPARSGSKSSAEGFEWVQTPILF